jgi:hypothetical protein
LQFQQKTSRLTPVGETSYGKRAEKTPEENAQAQVQEAAPASEIPSSQKLSSPGTGEEGIVPEGKKVRIRVRTVNCVYVGDFLIPPMRNRVSDAINEEQRLFISLTDVVINDKDRSDFVAVNKNLIESIAQI